MPELTAWGNFYVVVGSAAGALIGLQFVVMTLVAQRPHRAAPEGASAFATPTIVHLCSVLLVAAVLSAPWSTTKVPALFWGLAGVGGILYLLIIMRRMTRQSAYKPVLEDWLFHAWLPLAAYVLLSVMPLVARVHVRNALYGVGATTLLLLFTAIHNAWDAVAYHVLVNLREEPAEKKRE